MIANPSPYQKDVFNFLQTGKGSLVINAVAGSGKTATLVHMAGLLDDSQLGDSIFVAFSKAIAEELKQRLPAGMTCKTIHAVGYSVLRDYLQPRNTKNWVDSKKYSDFVYDALGNQYGDLSTVAELRIALENTINYCQLTLTDPTDADAMLAMMEHYDIEIPDYSSLEAIQAFVVRILERGRKSAGDVISFNDMLWLPVDQDLEVPKYGFIMIDEAQDLNTCMRVFLAKLIRPDDSRVFAVGDPKQAIFGFAGADVDSFELVKDAFNASELPLSICYRCPKSHVEIAKQLVPQIEAAATADEGIVQTVKYEDVMNLVSAELKDMIICRTNAPLVKLAFNLIAAGVPARIKGRDLLGQLATMIKATAKLPNYTWDTLLDNLGDYTNNQVNRLKRYRGSEMQIASVTDRADVVSIIYTRARLDGVSDVDGLIRYMDKLYSEDTAGCVTLSSIHRAKGLEAGRVFLLCPEKLPHPMASTEWQVEQEYNLQYVAYTRAKGTLTFIEGLGEDYP